MNTLSDNSPLVEIVIAAHNPGRYLLESVRSALRQTYRNIRVTVIDDGSTDRSIDTIADIGDDCLRIIRQDNAGKSVVLNRVFEESAADYVAIQDADDLSHPRRIELLVDAMQQYPDAAAVFSGHELIIGGRHTAPLARAKSIAQVAADINAMRQPAHDPTAMFRLSRVRDITFEPTLRIGQGYDHVLRVGERFPMLVIGECLYAYRVHTTSNTQRQINQRVDAVLRVIERACQRRGYSREQTAARISAELNRLQRRLPLNNVAAHFMESVLDQRDRRRRRAALRTAIDAVRLAPLSLRHYKPLAYALAPRAAIDFWRTRTAESPAPQPALDVQRAIIEPKPDGFASCESKKIHSPVKVQHHV